MRRTAIAIAVPAGVALALLAVISTSASAPAPEDETVTCSYVEAGPPGPSGNQLSIARATTGDLAVGRRSDGILVTTGTGTGQSEIPCGGPAEPTVQNVDTIVIGLSNTFDAPNELTLDLQGGPLAPGATPEASGQPEIEVQVSGGLTDLKVLGGSADEHFMFGGAGKDDHLAGELNSEESPSDFDVTLNVPHELRVLAGAGDDQLGMRGAGGFQYTVLNGQAGADTLEATGVNLRGGPGPDLVVGGYYNEWLNGGDGRDRVMARRGDDHVQPGGGADQVRGGRGNDTIKAVDGTRDQIECGRSNRDQVYADRSDQAKACELVDRR